MSSFLYIELDTTPPEIEIIAPSYTTTDLLNTIKIEADENISDYQEIYVIDSNGDRHDYTFKKEKANLLIGQISFFNFPFGLSTIYVRLKDNVDNTSELISKSIIIRETLTLLTLDIKDSAKSMTINEEDINPIRIDDSSQNSSTNNHSRKSTINNLSYKVSIDDYSINF